MNLRARSYFHVILIILAYSFTIMILDQASKFYIIHILDLPSKLSIVAVPGFFNLKMAWNEGINFGLFSSGNLSRRIALILISTLICLGIFLWAVRQKNHFLYLCASAIIGGAVGNLLDRILYGAVADFLNFTCCGIQNPYSFNVADISIFLGALGVIFFPSSSNKS
jgi:signal peptidase II